LYYGGQQISITYYSQDLEQEVTSPVRIIHGGGNDYDSEKHGLAGPFFLEGWNKITDLKINLFRVRNVGAISTNPAPIAEQIITGAAGCGNGPWHTKYFDGILNMFQYFIEVPEGQNQEDDVRAWLYDYIFDNDPTAFPMDVYDCDYDSLGNMTWYVHMKRLGLTSHTGTPPINVTYGTQWYRRLNYIYATIDGEAFTEADNSVETVYNWTINEYENALVWDLNINYNLKQIHYKHWEDDGSNFTIYGDCFTTNPYDADGFFPTGSEDMRFLREHYNNELDDVSYPDFVTDRILSVPWMTYSPGEKCFDTPPSIPIGSREGVLEGLGGYPFDIDADGDDDLVNFTDWTPAGVLNVTSLPILKVNDESDLTPTPQYTLSGVTSKERWTLIEGVCAALADDEMAQLVESTSTLEYWY
jgi:hypothetical protein